MDSGTAAEILLVAKNGGFLDEAIPEDEKEQLALGKWWLDQAHSAFEHMPDNETVLAIIELGKNGDGAAEQAAPEQPEGTPPENVVEENAAEAEEEPVAEEAPEPVGSPQPESTRESPVQQSDRNHGLPVPPPVEGEVMPMPRDLTSIEDRPLRRLMGEYNACFARATWEAAIEGADLTNAEKMMDHAERVARRNAPRTRVDGTKANQKDLDDIAREDLEFQMWEQRYLEHDRRFRELRALKDIYEGHLERLSREASIRDQEFKRST